MSKNDYVPAMYNRIPTVAALNQVPGFDPMKLLRRMVSTRTGEEVFRLDLQYKKLWFRLAHPDGRIKLKPLRITEQMAIYEARIYLSREDLEPVSNFTASILRTDAPNGQYIQAAQEEAVDKALTDAGFGIQLSDISVPESKRNFGCEVPVSAMDRKAATAVTQKTTTQEPVRVQKQESVKKTAEKAVTKTTQRKPDAVKVSHPLVDQPQPVPEKETVLDGASVPQAEATPTVATKEAETPVTVVNKKGADQALEILRRRNAAVSQTAEAEQSTSTAAPGYTKDMPVEQILELMTLEQAKKVVVDAGTCRGKTMEEVAARRIASVRFYLTAGYTSDNNIVRAAARIVLDNLDLKKAG